MKVGHVLNAGDRALLETLLREVGPRVLAYVRRAFGELVDAEEVVAETFARAADNVAALRDCQRRDLYLLTTARNLCRDVLRRRRPEPIADARLSQHAAGGSAPDERLANDELCRRLRAAVDRLPVPQREVVALRLSAELRFDEIADLLGIPLGTALSRMNAALCRLRKELGYAHARQRL